MTDSSWYEDEYEEAVDADPVESRIFETYSPDERARRIADRGRWIGDLGSWTCGICELPIDPEYWRSRLGSDFDSQRRNLKPEVDHVIPRGWGGPDEDENLQIAHAACNRHKHDKLQLPPEAARRFLVRKLGMAADPGPRIPPFRRAPGGRQGVALEAAVERDEPGPMFFLAIAIQTQDPGRAERLLRRAAELGYVPPRRQLLLLSRRRGDLGLLFQANGRAQLEAAVQRGDPRSMLDLARTLRTEDRERSEQLFRRALELGCEEGLVDLGLMMKGKDDEQAIEFFRRAAEGGRQRGMYELGLMLYCSDKEVGLAWLDRAFVESGWLEPAFVESGTLQARDRLAKRKVSPVRGGVMLAFLPRDLGLEKATEVRQELAEWRRLQSVHDRRERLYPADDERELSRLKGATPEIFRWAGGTWAAAAKHGKKFLMKIALLFRNPPG